MDPSILAALAGAGQGFLQAREDTYQKQRQTQLDALQRQLIQSQLAAQAEALRQSQAQAGDTERLRVLGQETPQQLAQQFYPNTQVEQPGPTQSGLPLMGMQENPQAQAMLGAVPPWAQNMPMEQVQAILPMVAQNQQMTTEQANAAWEQTQRNRMASPIGQGLAGIIPGSPNISYQDLTSAAPFLERQMTEAGANKRLDKQLATQMKIAEMRVGAKGAGVGAGSGIGKINPTALVDAENRITHDIYGPLLARHLADNKIPLSVDLIDTMTGQLNIPKAIATLTPQQYATFMDDLKANVDARISGTLGGLYGIGGGGGATESNAGGNSNPPPVQLSTPPSSPIDYSGIESQLIQLHPGIVNDPVWLNPDGKQLLLAAVAHGEPLDRALSVLYQQLSLGSSGRKF